MCLQRERRSRAVSPVTDMLRRSMEKANAPLAPDRRRVSRHLLTDMNIAQLQVSTLILQMYKFCEIGCLLHIHSKTTEGI